MNRLCLWSTGKISKFASWKHELNMADPAHSSMINGKDGSTVSIATGSEEFFMTGEFGLHDPLGSEQPPAWRQAVDCFGQFW